MDLEEVERRLKAANEVLEAAVALVNELEQRAFELRQQEKAAK